MTGIGRRFTRIPWRSELPWPLLLFALFGSFGYTILLLVGYVALPGWKLGFFGYMGCLAGLNLILCALLYLWLKKKGSARFAEL